VEVVKALQQVAENIEKLENARSNPSNASAAAYRALIKRGTCFVPYTSKDGLAFAPSRFVGYVENNLSTHTNNPDRDGRVTNAALNKIFGSQPRLDESLEHHYLAFCAQVGVEPSQTGAFGVARKYWVTSDALEIMESDATTEILRNPEIPETEKQQLIRARIGQGQFREQLLSYWRKCCLTGCELQSVLRASHIKPWRVSTNIERLDLYNGLLLSPNMDALFDKGLISFQDTGEIMVSSQLSESALKSLGCSSKIRVLLKPEHLKYLAHHRENQFVGAAD
jgi:putative restriction endonuclease